MQRALVAVVGGLLTLTGVALLVLPGPGFVLVAAGLALLATKFAWAARPLAYAKLRAELGMDEVARSAHRLWLAAAFACMLLVAGVLEIAGVNLPYVNLLSAAMLILSGVGLLGTLVYAHRRGRARAAGMPAGRPSSGPTGPAHPQTGTETGAGGPAV